MAYSTALDADINPSLVPALEALRWHLMDVGYSNTATYDITWYVALEQTLAGAPYLEPQDEAQAELAYVAALPAVLYNDPSWGDLELAPRGANSSDGPDVGYGQAPDEFWRHPHHPDNRASINFDNIQVDLPPISGGSPEPYGDEDYESWLAAVDQPYPPDDQVEEQREWYARHPLAEFNAVRPD